MAAPHDADIGGVERAKRRKKVVRRKPPPLPMPDMEATLVVPHVQLPKPARRAPRSVVVKRPPAAPRAPHGGHVPIVIQKTPVLDMLAPPKPGSKRDRQTKAFNQQDEKDRRAALKAERVARDARKAAVRKLPPEARKLVGADKLHEFIRTGEVHKSLSDQVGAILRAIGHPLVNGPSLIDLTQGAAHAVGNSLEDKIGGLIDQRRRGPHGLTQTVADVGRVGEAVGRGASDVALGPNLTKAMAGEDYDPKWALAEMGLLAVPIKGLPTPLTTRALMGFSGSLNEFS